MKRTWNHSFLAKRSLVFVTLLLAVSGWAQGPSQTPVLSEGQISSPQGLFSPSNARTEDGKLIPVDQFFPSTRCAKCHADTHAMWSESLHRNAAREPFYRESVDILLHTRGIEPTRHCESCHTPIALFSGALTKTSPRQEAPFTTLDDEGVTCSVCHSITAARLDGTGSFTIRRPALLAKEDGTPIFGDFTDEQILADVPSHKRAVMRPLLRTPEFCSTCHKVDAPEELNQYKHIRGFSAYDEWQQSGASLESVIPFYPRATRAECRTCHMARVDSLNDRAAKNGTIASHQWLGANTAAPLFYGQTGQADRIASFLKSTVVTVDIFALSGGEPAVRIAPLDAERPNPLYLKPGEAVTAEVVVSNRTAAHTFPPEVRDLYEAWLQFEAIDASGKAIFKSGFLKPDGMLDESAHVYKQLILDKQSRPITRHQIWLTNIKAYDNAIPPGRSDVVRYRFAVPTDFDGSRPITLRATVNYRRVNHEFSEYVLSRRHTALTIPVVSMAVAETRLEHSAASPENDSRTVQSGPALSRRWNDYGIGLMEQRQYGPAAEAFSRAIEMDPSDPSLLVNNAVAEMRTERFGPERTQFHKAAALLERALKLDPLNCRARFYRALVWRGLGRLSEAAEELKAVAGKYPRDREVQRQLGQTLYSLGRFDDARVALETVISIDPTDAAVYDQLVPLYRMEGRIADAQRVQSLYLQWRDDPVADVVASRFFAAHPEWSDERVTSHIHGQHSQGRRILTGESAAPIK